MDIEGAFDSTLSIAITQAMIRHEIPETLVDWTENMLAGRISLSFMVIRTLNAHQAEADHKEGFYPH